MASRLANRHGATLGQPSVVSFVLAVLYFVCTSIWHVEAMPVALVLSKYTAVAAFVLHLTIALASFRMLFAANFPHLSGTGAVPAQKACTPTPAAAARTVSRTLHRFFIRHEADCEQPTAPQPSPSSLGAMASYLPAASFSHSDAAVRS